jgi:hypothetical protein
MHTRLKVMAPAATGLAVVAGLALAPASAGPSASTGAPSVIRDVRASHDDVPLGKVHYPIDGAHPQPDTQTEPSIAVNPANPKNAVTAFLGLAGLTAARPGCTAIYPVSRP